MEDPLPALQTGEGNTGNKTTPETSLGKASILSKPLSNCLLSKLSGDTKHHVPNAK